MADEKIRTNMHATSDLDRSIIDYLINNDELEAGSLCLFACHRILSRL